MNTRQFLATFCVGALFGASVLLTLRGHDLDLLYLRLTEKRNEVNQLQEDYDKLKEKLTHIEKENVRKIRKINVVVDKAPDEFIKLAVQKEVKNRMRKLIDKDLKLFEESPDIFREFLDHRQLHITDHTVTLKVVQVVIGETTTLYIEATKEPDLQNTSKEP